MTSCNTGLSRDVRERYISYKASSFSSKADLPLKRNEILNLEQLKKLSYQEQLPVVESLIHDHFGQKPDDIFCPLNLGTLHNIFFIKISNKEFVLKTTLKNLSYLAY
ncbi:MAG: hypothetical protein KKH06_04785, partial [Gammaproteobacteria bacterium]|nr:hypothetical protein [Gammaproteobacteria bacterium]